MKRNLPTCVRAGLPPGANSLCLRAKEMIHITSKATKYALLSGLWLCAAGIMTVQAQNTYITFSVDRCV